MTDPLNDPDEFPIHGMQLGRVINRDDPKGIGRVKLEIPGLDAETAWARPLTTLFGGSAQRGLFVVPRKGATCAVWFHNGDRDSPYYLPAHYGASVPDVGSEVPDFVRAEDVADRPDMFAIETDKFAIVIDDRDPAFQADGVTPDLDANQTAPRQRLLITFKDDPNTQIEIDAVARGVTISATAGVRIQSTGIIELDANQIQFTVQGVTRRVGAVTKDV